MIILSCNRGGRQKKIDIPALYPAPLTVNLDTVSGYSINLITGDSIKPLVNESGIIINTGKSVLINGIKLPAEKISPPVNINPGNPIKKIIEGNVTPLYGKLQITQIDTSIHKKITPEEGGYSKDVKKLKAVFKKMPFSEPQPKQAAAFKYKDGATANVQYFDVDQGLSYPYVYALLQDNEGNFWFGNDVTGLTKYDGVNLYQYSTKNGLVNNTVFKLMLSSKGEIWACTYGGISVFDGKNFYNLDLFVGTENKLINCITEDHEGNIWLGTFNGLIKYDGNDLSFYTRKNGLLCDSVLSCKVDKKGKLWISSSEGLSEFDGKSFKHYTQRDGLAEKTPHDLVFDKNGTLWICYGYEKSSQGALTRFNGKTFTTFNNRNGLPANYINNICEDSKGNLWLGSLYNGIIKFDGEKFTQYNLQHGLSNNKIRNIIQDDAGNIWMATDGGGVNRLNEEGFHFLQDNEVLVNNKVRPIIRDKKGNMWFGTEGDGIGKYGANVTSGEPAGFTYFTWDISLNRYGQRTLLEDKEAAIWVGTIGAGVYKFNGKTVKNYGVRQGLSDSVIFSLLQDKNENIWIGTRDKGITRIDGATFYHYTDKQGLPSNRIFSIIEDHKNKLWFATETGAVFTLDGNYIKVFAEKEGLFCKYITCLVEDDKGNIWMGTQGAGVCKFNGKQFTYFTEKEGLSNNNVWSLFIDKWGQLWAGTDKGLNCLIPQKNNYLIYNYGQEDGLKAIDFNLHGIATDTAGNTWWGTGENVLLKNMRSPIATNRVPTLNLNYIEINERFYDFHNLPDSVKDKIRFQQVAAFHNYPEGLKLKHNQNHLGFHFSAIDWGASAKIKYSYRMVGLNENWSKPSASAFADYRGLSYGDYSFEIIAIGQSQQWSKPFIYRFKVLPAWWQSLWFKLLIIVAGACLAFLITRFIYFYQLRKQKAALEKQLAVQYERQRISAEMHDDIGAGLSGIRLLTEMTKNKLKDEQAAAEVDKIYQSVGNISSKMKEVIWSLNTENDTINNLITYIQRQARSWLEHYPCKLQVLLPDVIPDKALNGETRRNIYLVVKEAVHNIIKHSGADKVHIEIQCHNNFLDMTIADNGRGIYSPALNKSGNGMKNMKQRVKRLNGKFNTESKEGLTLHIRIPLNQAI